MRWLNWIMMLANYRRHRQFTRGTLGFQSYQNRWLMGHLRKNKDTVFGKAHGFESIGTVADFRRQVPVMDYETLRPYIERAARGEEKQLTEDAILLFEKSSGTTSASKLIPYTKSLKDDFMEGIEPWLFNLYQQHPKLHEGTAYWSVSPIHHDRTHTDGGIPIGFLEDTGYFSPLQRWVFNQLFSVPGAVKTIDDVDDFRYATMFFLLQDAHLGLISVWNPTFLSLLLMTFDVHKEQLCEDIREGHIRLPSGKDVPKALKPYVKSNKKRSDDLIRHCSTIEPGGPMTGLWPKLTVISCWDQASARPAAKELQERFPKVHFQGKGILATEGLITIPMEGAGHVVSYRSHFFEFIPVDGQGEVLGSPVLLNQLKVGQIYSVLMTTSGGFYRYRLYDLVKVDGKYKGLPMLSFVSKEAMVSDLVGEKVNGYHVQQILSTLNLGDAFCFVAPVLLGKEAFYGLFIEGPEDRTLKEKAVLVEEGLGANYHYAYARHLGQLAPVRAFRLNMEAQKAFYNIMAKDQRLGDIKLQPLVKGLDFHEHLPGKWIEGVDR